MRVGGEGGWGREVKGARRRMVSGDDTKKDIFLFGGGEGHKIKRGDGGESRGV